MASLHVIGCRAFISIINHDQPTLRMPSTGHRQIHGEPWPDNPADDTAHYSDNYAVYSQRSVSK